MRAMTIGKIMGVFLMLFSLSMFPPMLIAMIFHEAEIKGFLISFALCFCTGAILWLSCKRSIYMLKTRDGFLVVVLFWVVAIIFASFPFVLNPQIHMGFTNDMFETVSGLTTTGATVFTHIDKLPHVVRYYRQQLQLLGGMGIIVLAVAILPMLGIGGLQLYRAEIPSPVKDSKLTPRITETAKALWLIYIGLTVLCAFCYWLAGMNWFDALGESFGTVATGGFSVHSSSFAYYHSMLINDIACFFMFLGGANFALHFAALRGFSLKAYLKDYEFVSYVCILLAAILVCIVILMSEDTYQHFSQIVQYSIFTVISLFTTTGFTITHFHLWPTVLPILIMFGALMGGCAGSTTGGIKVLRLLLLYKQSGREIKRLIHPRIVSPISFGDQILSEDVIQAMWGYIAIFVSLFIMLLLLLMVNGMSFLSAFAALVATQANAGASIGSVASGFAHLSVTIKWILMFAMLAGRLEVFTLLVLFTPWFWQR